MKKLLSIVISTALAVSLILCTVVITSAQSRSGSFSKNYTLTGEGAHDICAVAKAQIGKSEYNLGYSEAWCADFVSDCAKLAGVSDAVPFCSGCTSLKNAIINAGGQVVSTPKAGDIAFYDCCYCGIVHSAIITGDDSSVHGNYNDCVTGEISRYRYSDSDGHRAKNGTVAVCCVRPKYRAIEEIEEESVKKPTVSGDFDGDGDTDIVQFNEDGSNAVSMDLFRSNGSYFSRSANVWRSGNGWKLDKVKRHIAAGDFNNDGKDDICAFYDYGKGESRAFVWLSTGNGFSLSWNWWYIKTGFNSSLIVDRMVAGDFNGDGRDDICAFYDYGKGESRAFVWTSNGRSFSLNWNWWYMPKGFDAKNLSFRVVAGDFNGDKKDDVCAFYDYGKGETRAFVWQSCKTYFSLNWNWFHTSGFDAKCISDKVVAGDFNKDGKDDICAFYDYGHGETRAFVWQSQGGKFGLKWNWWYMSSGFNADNIRGRVVAGDFNKDGDCDVAAYYMYNDKSARMFVFDSWKSCFSMKWNWWNN